MSGDLPAFEVGRQEVLRLLGYRRGRAPRARLVERIEELCRQATTLLQPRGTYRMIDRAAAMGVGVPGIERVAAVGLCTIGRELETEAQRRAAEHRTLDALVLDAFGSAAAEAAADALNGLICSRAVERGSWPSPRVSPGYGRWDVRRQGDLLALLSAADLGVRLTSGGMMEPRKSVSFAVALLGLPPARTGHGRCARCGLVDCAYREQEATPSP